jgi:hypothetical protein
MMLRNRDKFSQYKFYIENFMVKGKFGDMLQLTNRNTGNKLYALKNPKGFDTNTYKSLDMKRDEALLESVNVGLHVA